MAFRGLAVLAARQNAYGTWDDFVTRVRKESLAPLFLRATWKAPGFDIRFAYSAWGYFLQWTIEIRGRPLFQKLLIGFMDHPVPPSGFGERPRDRTAPAGSSRTRE